jgi:DNA polymerase-2
MHRGYILYQKYYIDKIGNPIIELYGKLDTGKSFKIIEERVRPYLYIREQDENKAVSIFSKAEFKKVDKKNFEEEKVIKVTFQNPKVMSEIRKIFSDNNISSFESDINIINQYLMEKDILRTFKIKDDAVSEKDDYVDYIFKNPEIERADEFDPKLRLLSIDIETSMDAKQLYSISLVTNNGYKNAVIVSSQKLNNAVSVESEKEALLFFRKEIKSLDPDIIVGWNVVDFDFKILQTKFKKYGIPFNLGRNDEECTLRIQSDFLRDSTADFNGRIILDGIHLLKSSFIQLDDYKLSTAAKEFLGDDKLITGDDNVNEIEQAYLHNQQKLIDYNIKDSELVLRILDKTNVLGITIKRSFLTGLTPDRVKASVASLDSLYIRELHKRGIIAYTKNFGTKEEKILGGYVKKPKPGIYDYVLVLDFKSLYPSIIRTFNIDPLSYTEQKTGDVVIAPNGAMFKNEEGILPYIIKSLWAQRDIAKKEKDLQASYAIKILMNSFYGVLANDTCRFFNPKIANAITHFGQYLIKLTGKEVEMLGYKVLYSDTDSIFVKSNAKDYDEAKKIGEKIQVFVNNFFDEFIVREYKRKNNMELEFEKIFIKLLMPMARGSEEGSKKRYAGLVEKNGKKELVFTGLEFVRSDWTEVSKHFQLGLIDLVFNEKPVDSFIKTFAEDLRKGKYDADLVYRKSLRKDVTEYTKTTPPHVKAARLLDKIDSNIIKYYQTVDGPQPVQKVTSRIDYDHYIEKQIKPIADSVLVFFDKNFDDVIQGEKQKGLGAFF